jgi:hypothetical protein
LEGNTPASRGESIHPRYFIALSENRNERLTFHKYNNSHQIAYNFSNSQEKAMNILVFVIGLFIGGFLGIMLTSVLVLSRDGSENYSKKGISVSLRSEVPLGEEYPGVRQQRS